MIIGAEGVGLAAVGMAKAVLKTKIIVADVDPLKRERHLKPAQMKLSMENGITKELLKQTDGGPYGVVDFVGAPATCSFGFQVLAKEDWLLLDFTVEVWIYLYLCYTKGSQHCWILCGNQRDLVELLDLVKQGRNTGSYN